ncbi:hypothetical protein [Bradyrhizobium sp. STM 3557]|uniref:hypothetical protein n=1 Tax=Bradyrhizobium sp. STM 3557 TaxID=578920 RepID=UPI00388FC9A7
MVARAGTEVDAANLALSDLGQPPITSFSDNTARARACRVNFGTVRDALLQQHEWGFATAYARPAAAVAPVGGWPGKFANRFLLPSDCLQVRYVAHSGADSWEVITAAADPPGSDANVKVLSTNDAAPEICYTRCIVDVRLWSGQFLKGFRHELAAAIAPLVVSSTAKAQSEAQLAAAAVSDAALIDGKEKSRRTISRDTSWLRARRVGRWGRP